jgi:hypothetical protein
LVLPWKTNTALVGAVHPKPGFPPAPVLVRPPPLPLSCPPPGGIPKPANERCTTPINHQATSIPYPSQTPNPHMMLFPSTTTATRSVLAPKPILRNPVGRRWTQSLGPTSLSARRGLASGSRCPPPTTPTLSPTKADLDQFLADSALAWVSPHRPSTTPLEAWSRLGVIQSYPCGIPTQSTALPTVVPQPSPTPAEASGEFLRPLPLPRVSPVGLEWLLALTPAETLSLLAGTGLLLGGVVVTV